MTKQSNSRGVIHPTPTPLTRRQFLIGASSVALGAALAGCVVPTVQPAAAPTATGAATRQITDLYGRTLTIPADPQRIVTIDYSGLTVYLTAMGFNVIGATDYASDPATLPPEFVGGKSFESIGDLTAVNFEKVALLQPDLIVAYTYTREQFEPGEAIAPVLGIADDVVDKLSEGPFGLLRYLGEILDRQNQAEVIEQEVRQKLEAFDLVRGKRAAIINPLNYAAPVNFFMYATGAGSIPDLLGLLGFVQTPSEVDGKPLVGTDAREGIEVSLERAVEVLADCEVILVPTYGLYGKASENMEFFDQFKAHPIWARVPAVERDDVAYVEFETTNFGWGVKGVDLLLKQLTEQLGS